MNEHEGGPTMQWPLREYIERGLYFYLEATESYLPDCRVRVAGHGDLIMLGSYSYLDLNGHPRINEAACDAIERFGTGTHGVRLLAGTLSEHRALEERIARFKGTDAAVTFSSGYLANVSTIGALVGRNDTVLCDKLDHASIVDGARLSRAEFVRFRHNDMDELESLLERPANRGRKLVVVDAVFSMEGDIVDLPEVCRLCRKHGAMLMVDEAHSLGVLGATGHGIEEHFGLPADCVDIKMGTLSKTIPSVGGYVAASAKICEVLAHQGRGFIYSAALPAPAAAAARVAFDVIETEPGRVSRLHRNVEHFASMLKGAGLLSNKGLTPVFPIICGDDLHACNLARYCQKQGIYIQAILHPVVPQGTSRLRAAVTSAHTPEILEHCVSIIAEGARKIGIAG